MPKHLDLYQQHLSHSTKLLHTNSPTTACNKANTTASTRLRLGTKLQIVGNTNQNTLTKVRPHTSPTFRAIAAISNPMQSSTIPSHTQPPRSA